MLKTTLKKSNKLTKRLAQYGALTVAIAGVSETNGQIIYTDLSPDFAGGNGTNFALDMDNDAVADFGIIGSAAPAVGFYGILPSNSWVGSNPSFKYPFALNSGEVISSAQTIWYGGTSNVGTLNYVSCYGGAGGSNWCGVTDKYLGLRFQIAGNTHYGWARMDVSASGDSFTVKDYAYNSVAGEAINAGQTVLGIDENQFSNIRIAALNKTISISNLTNQAEYTLFDMTGKSVMTGKTQNNVHAIEAKTMSSGVYILQLKDINTDATIKQKIVL